MSNSKIWLVFMCGPEAKQHIEEIWNPISEFFHGIVCTYHGDPQDECAKYLESIKGDGEVIYTKYSRRHDFSRNHYLFCGPQKNGDWCVQIDMMERIPKVFAKDILAHIVFFKSNRVNMVVFHGKPYIFEFHDSLTYAGNPHEGLHRRDGKMVALEYNLINANEDEVRKNVRAQFREQFHFVDNYLKYYLFPWGANHCLLSLEKRDGDLKENFVKREGMRISFLETLDELGIDRTVDAVKAILNNIPRELLGFFESEKILNDVYRYYVLKDTGFKDDHDHKNLVKIK